MQSLTISLMVCVLLGGWNVAGESECKHPPSLWCSSRDVASSCQVLDQCEQFWNRQGQVKGGAPLVNFTLYYESLCPDCQNFIRKQLYPAFLAVGDIMNLTLVPYGNAEESRQGDKWVFECQHGEEECIGNILDTCLLRIVNNVKVAFPFIHCMEVSGQDKSMKAFQECSKKFPSLPLSQVLACENSTQGNQWEHEMALQTPPHKYVPWVTLNGVHNEVIQMKAQNDLIKLLCDTYTGTKPAGCQEKRAFHLKDLF